MIIEVFSCSGGMAEGFRRAGAPVEMAFDKDPDACASYTTNLGHAPVQIDARDLLRMVVEGSWRPSRAIDLFVADPPCTPWSRAGKRQGQADERDMLAVTVQLVTLLRPRAWLIANVPGLDDGPNWPTVQKTIGSLSAGKDGWCIDFVRLDAANYGVPQHRVRPFWFGHAYGTPHVHWPHPTHCDPKQLTNAHVPGTELAPWVTCRQALKHLQPEDLGSPVRLHARKWMAQPLVAKAPPGDAELVTTDAWARWRGSKGHQIASVPDRPARVVGTSNLSDGNILAHPTEAFRKVKKPSKKPRATSLDEPAGTVTTSGNGNGSNLYEGEAPRQKGDFTTVSTTDHRATRLDEPAKTLSRNTHSDGAVLQLEEMPDDEVVFTNGGHEECTTGAVLILRERSDGTIRESTLDAPAHTLRGTLNGKHPPNEMDAPSVTIGAKSDRGGQGATVLVTSKHPVSAGEEPAMTVNASDGGGSKHVMAWPWDRPSTNVQCDDRISPPGHHDLSFRTRSSPNAVKLSERAAAILQGFPDGWTFVGKTKRTRWSQLGQAMPPPLAHAVATAVRRQMKEAEALATSQASEIRDAARHRA